MLVVLVAADLVGCLAAELADVEWVKAHLGVRDPLGRADRVLIAGGHVDRDGLDRGLLLVGETVEERLQAGGVPALGRPHDPAGLVVGDAGQKLVICAVADLVHADQLKAVQAAVGQLLGHDASHDIADRLPADPHQPRHLRLAHLLRQPRGQIVEVARVARSAARPLDHLGQITAARAVQPAQPALDLGPQAARVEMPPALDAMVLDLQAARAAARTDRLLATQRDRHDHRPLAELHIPDPCARKPEHPVECRRDPHVALLRRQLNSEHSAACRSRGGGGSPGMCASCEPPPRALAAHIQ